MKLSFGIPALLAGLFCAGALQADIQPDIPACVQDTLADYISNFSGTSQCYVGILDYGRFSLTDTGATVPASDIVLTPQTVNVSGASAGYGGGFSFSGLSVSDGQTANYVVDWHFYVDPGPVSSGADIGMDPPKGNVTITQDFCLDSNFGPGAGPVYCVGANNPQVQSFGVTVQDPFNHITFNPPAHLFGNVKTIIDLNGINQPLGSGFDNLSGTLDAAPEPAVMLPLFGGLVALVLARRRKPVG